MERATISMRRFLVSRRRLLRAAGVAPAAFLVSANAAAECKPEDLQKITDWANANVQEPDRPDFIDAACKLWIAFVQALKGFDNTDLDDRQAVLDQALQRSGVPIRSHLAEIKLCGIEGTMTCAILCAHKSKAKKTWPWGKVNKKMFDDAWMETKSETQQVAGKGLAC